MVVGVKSCAQFTRVICTAITLLMCGCNPDDSGGRLADSKSATVSSTITQTNPPAVLTAAHIETYSSPGNPAPVIQQLGAQSTRAGQILSFNVMVSDPDGSVPVLTCVDCPTGASLDAAVWGGVFSWQPPPEIETREPYRITFRAIDAVDPLLVAEKSVYITVADEAPQLAVIEDVAIHEGQTLELPLATTTTEVVSTEFSVIIFDAPLTDSLTARGVDFNFTRSSDATYKDDSGRIIHAPPDTPRFLPEHRGLLIEGKRTNLIAPSINLGSMPWTGNFGGMSIDNFGIAPDGTITSSLVEGGTNPLAGRKIPVTLRPLDHYEFPADRYVVKVHIKPGSSRLSRYGVYNDTRLAWESFVEVSWNNGLPSVTASNNTTSDDPTDHGQIYLEYTGYEGWWTLEFSFQKDATTTPSDEVFFQIEPDCNGTYGHIEVWGAQLEPGHLSTSYIHNTTTSPKVREPDLLAYDIGGFALGFPSNNVMVENEFFPRWHHSEVRGWHPRFWGSMVDESTYFLARISRSSANFVATRTFDADALREDVTLGRFYRRDDLVRVAVRAKSSSGLDILPDFISNKTCGIELLTCVENREDQAWGDRLMIGNLTGLRANNMPAAETDGPLNAPIRHMRVHVLDAETPNIRGVSLVNNILTWTPPAGAHVDSPFRVTVRATDANDPSVYVQQDVEITVLPLP